MTAALRMVLPIYGIPKPQSRPRLWGGRVISSGSPDLRIWRRTVEQAARSACITAPDTLATINEAAAADGYELELTFCMPTKDAKRHGKPHTIRPDTDNLAKAVMDSATDGGLLPNGTDAAVARLVVNKVWVPLENAGCIFELQAARIRDKSAMFPHKS